MSMTASRVTGNSTRSADLLNGLLPGSAKKRRNWARVGAGLALAVFSGSIFVLLYSSAGARHPFLAVVRPVAAGQILSAADIVEVRVSSDSVLDPIPADDAAAVVGRRAAVALVPGTLLVPGDLTMRPSVANGEASVGLILKYGQFPPGLAPGDWVIVVSTAGESPGSASAGGIATSGSSVLVSRARVLAVSSPSEVNGAGTGSVLVSLIVPADLAPAVVSAAAAADIGLAELGQGGGS